MIQKRRSLNNKDILVKELVITKQFIVLGSVSKETATELEAPLFLSLETSQQPKGYVYLPRYR